ncbi:hypothetical protein BCR32DRAFT_284002 [Anaeromyces robustus]|uniref:Uncharacterized protein n=1 Tax=Anaeromyces robustus TaxID=1754192 RepID=A0A1Y1WTG4_9FUNG|nr:hypothetical protein BCR32DRAFT_284002 [Anaeromyces robustus]|eukprot:ORX76588.1 hypothetical protein BCR32DRAFT_284002 [Anaeromyces robustus]
MKDTKKLLPEERLNNTNFDILGSYKILKFIKTDVVNEITTKFDEVKKSENPDKKVIKDLENRANEVERNNTLATTIISTNVSFGIIDKIKGLKSAHAIIISTKAKTVADCKGKISKLQEIFEKLEELNIFSYHSQNLYKKDYSLLLQIRLIFCYTLKIPHIGFNCIGENKDLTDIDNLNSVNSKVSKDKGYNKNTNYRKTVTNNKGKGYKENQTRRENKSKEEEEDNLQELLKVFGYLASYKDFSQRDRKFGSRGIDGAFLGFNKELDCFINMDLNNLSIHLVNDVTFDEYIPFALKTKIHEMDKYKNIPNNNNYIYEYDFINQRELTNNSNISGHISERNDIGGAATLN